MPHPSPFPSHLRPLADAWENETHRLLRWWTDHMVDHQKGGFYGRRDAQGVLHPDADKGVILNTRILWSFAHAARRLKSDQAIYRTMATRANRYLIDHFWDGKHGGMYWLLDAKGRVKEAKKQVYAQAFAIYGLSEYVRLTGEAESLTFACLLFQYLEKYSHDPQRGGYLEAFAQDWGELEDLRLSAKDLNAAKTMNTHLHVLEAYTNLYRVWPNTRLAEALRKLIELFMRRFVREDGHLHLFFDAEWRLLSQEVSFGHDIEASWLLCEAAEVLGEAELQASVERLALRMVDLTLVEGLDPAGGLYNEAGPGGHLDRDKHWWPQVEAMVGCVNAWQLTGQAHYLQSTEALWTYLRSHFLAANQGEWPWGIDAQQQFMTHEDLAGPWKGPYHHTRALIECARRVGGE